MGHLNLFLHYIQKYLKPALPVPNQLIPEAGSFKYLGIIIRSDLNWADHVNYTLRTVCKALHLIMRVYKKGNNIIKRLNYTVLVTSIPACRAVYCDPYREIQVSVLNRVQRRAAKFENNTRVRHIKNLIFFIS